MIILSDFPDCVNVRQWVAWRYQHIPGKTKPKKPPIDPKTGALASPTDPATWATYAEACAYAKSHHMAGVGLVLTQELGLSLVDLDNCFDGAGALLPWAKAIIDRLDSYTEYSPSGKGLHILVYGAVAALKTDQVEIYSAERYTTVTGRPYGPVRPIRHAQAELEALRGQYAPTEQATPSTTPTSGKRANLTPVDASDEAVIAILCGDSKQAARWAGNVTGNRSSHLYGLINGLIWLCGPDTERIGRLVRQSGLYDAKRHDRNSGAGHSNLDVSIYNACATWRGDPYKWPTQKPCNTLLQGKPAPAPEPEPTLTDKLVALRAWLRRGGLAVMTKGRTHDTDLAVADALIDIAIERGRLDNLAIGLERLRSMAGLGSTSTARKALDRMGWLVSKDSDGDRVTHADAYSINVGALDWAVELALAPESIYCTKSHDEKTHPKNIMRFGTLNNFYSEYRSSDCFSTGWGGLGRTFGNEMPGAGKLLLLLIDVMRCEGLPMTCAQLADVTGRNSQVVSRALARANELGLLERQQESCGRGRPSYWYSVPGDIEQRIALVAVDLRTFGAGVDRAKTGAYGLREHAKHLLDPDRDTGPILDAAQTETLKAWLKLANVEFKGLCQVADLAATLDRGAIKEKIAAGAVGADHNRRAMRAAREFSRSILVDERQSPDPKKRPSPKQDVRLFRYWAALNGYNELAGDNARITVELALKTVQHTATVQPAPAPRIQFGDLKRIDRAATFVRRFGVEMPAQVAA